MSAVEDVASAIVRRTGTIDTYKLQKLLFFAQTVQLAWHDRPLFRNDFRAYRDGPVVDAIFKQFQGKRYASAVAGGNADAISPEADAAIEFVLGVFGEMSGDDLSRLTHDEGPWPVVRRAHGLGDGDPGYALIPKDMIRDYGRSKHDFMDQAWYWTPEWLAGERQAQTELERGEGTFLRPMRTLSRPCSNDHFVANVLCPTAVLEGLGRPKSRRSASLSGKAQGVCRRPQER